MNLKSVRLCIIRISIFLLLICSLIFNLFDILKRAFLYNIEINSVIILSLISGITFVFHRLFLYEREYSKLLRFDSLSKNEIEKLSILKPITLYITKKNKTISQSKLQTILGSIEKKTDDYSSFPKYITGILIFLGLLGTFWGLSHTIGNVANIIDNLGIEQSDAAASFLQLKSSLKIPLEGMGIAFGCSLFGLSGSLILGFLTANKKSVTADFLDKVEEWITKHTVSFDVIDNHQEYHGSAFSMGLLEKTIETIYAFQNQLQDLDGNKVLLYNMQKEISQKISKLSDALNSHQEIIKTLVTNQVKLQDVTISLNKKIIENGVFHDISNKLSSVDSTLNLLVQSSISNKEYIVNSLGEDIKMVSKTLSSLIRE